MNTVLLIILLNVVAVKFCVCPALGVCIYWNRFLDLDVGSQLGCQYLLDRTAVQTGGSVDWN